MMRVDTPSRWNEPIKNPPLEQDWPSESSVRVRHAVEGPLREDLGLLPADDSTPVHPADETRIKILKTADRHITEALSELNHAVKWFGAVDRSDHADLVRRVEGLADTIAYRLRNAEGEL